MDDTQQKETRRRIKVCLDALISELKSRGFKVTRKDENTLIVNGMTFTATDQLSDTYNDVCYLLTDYQQMIECTLSRISECADTIIELLDVQLEKGGKMRFSEMVNKRRMGNKGIVKSNERLQLLRDEIHSHLKCSCAMYQEFWWDVEPISDKLYRFSYEGTDYGLNLADDVPSHILNYDFKVTSWDKQDRIMIIEDTKDDSRDLRNEPVLIVTLQGSYEMTLGQAIERYGIQSEGDPNDYRLFARCPNLNNLCGPMYPNDGFIARYESWEAYDLLSR